MTLGPAPILALLVGILHVSIYVLIRGTAGQRLPLLVLAAVLGAWAGDALAGRLGADPLRIGDFNLIGSSLLAWAGIGFVAVVAVLAPREGGSDQAPREGGSDAPPPDASLRGTP